MADARVAVTGAPAWVPESGIDKHHDQLGDFACSAGSGLAGACARNDVLCARWSSSEGEGRISHTLVGMKAARHPCGDGVAGGPTTPPPWPRSGLDQAEHHRIVA